MKTVPGIDLRGSTDKSVQVRCPSCNEVGFTLPPDKRLVRSTSPGADVEVPCKACGATMKLRVKVDAGTEVEGG